MTGVRAWHGLACLALFLAVLLPAEPAAAEDLIFTLSANRIRIQSDFSGTGLTAFGAIERDAETVSRGAAYDVVVVMRGPNETLVTRRKDSFFGIWLNGASRTFVDLPSFYLVSASRPLDQISTPAILKRYQIGADNLSLETLGGPDADGSFRGALTRLKQQAGLFLEQPYGVTFPGTTVFQASLAIPANVPVGQYHVSAYLFSDSALLATENLEVVISKAGFEQVTFDLARHSGFLYGMICVALALLTGWLAGVVFRRD
ncbi:TIGR02186 family protein [Kaistia algarum]|uniref:TIGR02186 family protein n=1 Tax=Kaistia algarum TaxID=2083279 RepID=UPI000CE7944C|nr:TIGR02186 family protein [Kaistia algarum]MCX5513346.1 TIGR02186 family protein [Kaistia algarum]PPE81204.1 TIGR02186 family protein [Kaistia algarum]